MTVQRDYLHSVHGIAIGYKEVTAVIKTISMKNVLFWLLILAAAAAAIIFINPAADSDLPSIFTSGGTKKPVLVIDAGHGGEDGGATSLSGIYESELNLDISLKMAALSGLTGIQFIMTRESDEIEYPESAKSTAKRKKYDQKKRVELINSTENAVLISVHQNFYPHKSPHGPQSFYSINGDSDALAILIQETMNAALCPENRRLAMPVDKGVYLFKNVSCPAVLVECGFISNPEESKLLETETYRLKIAAALVSAYLRYTDTNK